MKTLGPRHQFPPGSFFAQRRELQLALWGLIDVTRPSLPFFVGVWVGMGVSLLAVTLS